MHLQEKEKVETISTKSNAALQGMEAMKITVQNFA
jgi:hypothetical protein